jgi:hypothetical protein
MGSATGTLVLFPPVDQRAEWQTPAEVLSVGLQDGTVPAAQLALVQSLETLGRRAPGSGRLRARARAPEHEQLALASARGETAKIDLEVSYYHLDPLTWSQSLFVLAFLCATVLWLRPKSRTLYSLTSGAAFLATLFVVLAIVMRCMIRSRPPVSTLYETVLFVTSVGASVALITEWIQRQRIAVSAAAIVGMVGLYIANGYETLDKKDTMPSLVGRARHELLARDARHLRHDRLLGRHARGAARQPVPPGQAPGCQGAIRPSTAASARRCTACCASA